MLSAFKLRIIMLSVVMLIVIMFKVIMLSALTLRVVTLSAVMLSFFMLGVGKTTSLLSASFCYGNGYIWQAILTLPNLPDPSPSLLWFHLT